MTHRLVLLAVGGLAVVTATVSAPGPATAAAAAPAVAPALIRSGHFSPDVAAVDVYLTGFGGDTTALWISSEGYGEVSGYRQLTPGLYVVSMRPHGASADSPAAVTWTIDAAPGHAYTAAAVGRAADLQARVLTDDLSATAPAGEGRVRVIQAASLAPRATITANGGITVADAVPFGTTTDYRAVPAGTWDLRATASTSGLVTAGAVSVPAGTASTVVLLDTTAGGLSLTSVVDTAGSGVVPVGAVDAGGGGTAVEAGGDASGTTPLLAVAVLGIVASGLVVTAVRARRRTG